MISAFLIPIIHLRFLAPVYTFVPLRLCPDRIVVFNTPEDGKRTKGFFRYKRMLYFIRAVFRPLRLNAV